MHVVRHPLKLLASSIDFGQCVECWAHIEDNSVPSLGSLAAPMRAALLRNRRARAGGKMGGRDWAEEAIDELLRGFMLYYVTWNPMIEGVAEYVKRTLLLLLLYQYYYCCCWATLLLRPPRLPSSCYYCSYSATATTTTTPTHLASL